MTKRRIQKIEVHTVVATLFYYPLDELPGSGLPADRRVIVESVVRAVEAYRAAISELLSTKYSELQDSLPDYLTKSGLAFVTCCSEGIIIRYDKEELDAAVGTWSQETLSSLVPALSENYVHCVARGQTLDLQSAGRVLTLSTTSPDGQSRDLMSIRAAVTAELPPNPPSLPTSRPNRITQERVP